MTGRSITVVLGTDHHPFERLVSWADDWQRSNPQDRMRIQHGYSPEPSHAQGMSLLAPDELHQLLVESDVVITHGGPGTIMAARNAGHQPLVLPRDPALGEHVDGHQMRFAAWAADKELIQLVGGESMLTSSVTALGVQGTRTEATRGYSTRDSTRRLVQLLEDYDPRRRPVNPDALTVLYLGGADLATAGCFTDHLSQLGSVMLLGPVADLWDPLLRSDQQCSCGASFARCGTWAEVALRAFGGWSSPDVAAAQRLRRSIEKPWTALRAGRRRPGAGIRRQVLEYASFHRKVYEAAVALTGARVLVDTSVSSTVALALSHDSQIDLRVLALPRSTGVVAAGGLRRRRVPVTGLTDAELSNDAPAALLRACRDLSLPWAEVPQGGAGRTSHIQPEPSRPDGSPASPDMLPLTDFLRSKGDA